MKKDIKFGIVGCGAIASFHADAIANIAGASLLGVSDNNFDTAKSFSERYGVKAYKSYDELLADKSIDAVCICTPSCFHAECAIKALKNGKNVALEKPMALNTRDADRVISATRESGKLLTVISQLRFSSDVLRAKKLVEEGALGKITLCSLYMKYYRSPEYYKSSSWKGKLAFDGGGALMNQGIHGVDLLEFIAGEVKSVSGKIRTLSHSIEVEDTAVANLEFESGALGVIVASTSAYPGFERRIEINGDEGYLVLKEDKIEKLMLRGVEEKQEQITVNGTAADPLAMSYALHKSQLENFVLAINGEAELLINCHEGRRALRIIEDIYRSEKG